jgi:cold shock CspA family protein
MTQFNGTIKYVNPVKGFGFIRPTISGRPDVFFSFDQMRGNAARLPQKGEKVVYEEGTGKRGPIALTVYNLADPMACEDYARDLETTKRLEAAKQAAQAGRKVFTAALIERNRQWHAARRAVKS